MSDFDKEAERKKLREKYERDRADREATQRMSDLLLKGATMTNTHCGTCGDPLFQQNGARFCPSCHGSPEAVEGTAFAQDADDTDAQNVEGTDAQNVEGTDAQNVEGTDAASEAGEEGGGADADDAATGGEYDPAGVETPTADRPDADRSDGPEALADRSATARRDATETRERPDATASHERSGTTTTRERPDTTASHDRPTASRDEGPAPPRTTRQSTGGELGAARESLVRALERFAAEAAEAEDPRHARECLEAAREAATALSALRR